MWFVGLPRICKGSLPRSRILQNMNLVRVKLFGFSYMGKLLKSTLLIDVQGYCLLNDL
jgi:hypothetical protein